VSTSFSATSQEFEAALKKMHTQSQRHKVRGKHKSELPLKEEEDDEEVIETNAIKEAESEDEANEESSFDEHKPLGFQRAISDYDKERSNSDLE
jgi:hypothetical protein